MKKSKKPTKIKNCPLEKNSEWFGHKTGEPTGFHDNVVIIQRKLMFPKKSFFQTDIKVVWYTLM